MITILNHTNRSDALCVNLVAQALALDIQDSINLYGYEVKLENKPDQMVFTVIGDSDERCDD